MSHTPERESALVRARELSEQLGDNAKLMEALLALAHIYGNRGLEQARQLAEKLLAMAEQAKAPTMLAGAHCLLGVVRFYGGRSLQRVSILNVPLNCSVPVRRKNW